MLERPNEAANQRADLYFSYGFVQAFEQSSTRKRLLTCDDVILIKENNYPPNFLENRDADGTLDSCSSSQGQYAHHHAENPG